MDLQVYEEEMKLHKIWENSMCVCEAMVRREDKQHH